jgi:hypothetical protein
MKPTRPHRFAKRVALGLIDVGNTKRYRQYGERKPDILAGNNSGG